MQVETNVEPLLEYLSGVISPKQLAGLLDELMYDFLKLVIRIHTLDETDSLDINSEADSYLFHLKSLRDALLDCKE